MQCIDESDSCYRNPLDCLNYAIVLSNRSNRNSKTTVESTVLDNYIGRVGLERDAIVAIVNDPVRESEVGGIDCVCSICVSGWIAVA